MGEVDFISSEHAVNRKVKCRKCGYSNEAENKGPEVFVVRKRPQQ